MAVTIEQMREEMAIEERFRAHQAADLERFRAHGGHIMKGEKMLTETAVKTMRGWTDRLIKQFAIEPDVIGWNPNGGRTRLYRVARLVGIEQNQT
jgi:hypothetical protein